MRGRQAQVPWESLLLLIMALYRTPCFAIKPSLDLANNMRLIMLPADTPIGSVIYRLRASDAEDDYPLTFKLYDSVERIKASDLLTVANVDCSKAICQADVVLARPLSYNLSPFQSESNRSYSFESHGYNLSLEVIDSKGESIVVEVEVVPTPPQGAFIGAPKMIQVPESTKVGSQLESFSIRSNPTRYRGVRCRLLEYSTALQTMVHSEFFEVSPGVPSRTSGQSQCDLKLKKAVDFESRSTFLLQVLAENAWTNRTFDTRNVAVHDVIIVIANEPDTPPQFKPLPALTKISPAAKKGDVVGQVSAFDGDAANRREIRFSLGNHSDNQDMSKFFSIDPDSGQIHVNLDLEEVDDESAFGQPFLLRVIAEEQGQNDDDDGHNKAVAEVAFVIEDSSERPPHFLQNTYVTHLVENAEEGTPLTFKGGLKVVESLNKGKKGTVALALDGHEDTFEVSPNFIKEGSSFVIRVKNNKKLDYEATKQLSFKITATELGSNEYSTSANITVHLLDANDNDPIIQQESKFDGQENEASVFEDARSGTLVFKVLASDADSGQNGQVRFTKLSGDPVVERSLVLDSSTGEVSVSEGAIFDRESSDSHLVSIEATDEMGANARVDFIIRVMDANDNPPIFTRKSYIGFLTADLTNLRGDLQVQALDADEVGTRNSEVMYEIVSGNYLNKFRIDQSTGEISLAEPFTGTPATDRGGQTPVATLIIRAYDLGVPSQSSQIPVQIFTTSIEGRTMRFIVAQDPSAIGVNINKISDLISTMTGGVAEIQNILPYLEESPRTGSKSDQLNSDAPSVRGGKNMESRPIPQKSVLDVFVRFPGDSVIVDIEDVASKLVASPDLSISSVNQSHSVIKNTTAIGSNGTSMPNVIDLQQRNYSLFWGLVSFSLLVVLAVLIILCCYCCPGCYPPFSLGPKNKLLPSYRESVLHTGRSDEITVLAVKNERGENVRDARFVEVLKPNGNRFQLVGLPRKVHPVSDISSQTQSHMTQALMHNNTKNHFKGSGRTQWSPQPQLVYHNSESAASMPTTIPQVPLAANSDRWAIIQDMQRSKPGPPEFRGDVIDGGSRRPDKAVEDQTNASDPHGNLPPSEEGQDIEVLHLDQDGSCVLEETYKRDGKSEVLNLERHYQEEPIERPLKAEPLQRINNYRPGRHLRRSQSEDNLAQRLNEVAKGPIEGLPVEKPNIGLPQPSPGYSSPLSVNTSQNRSGFLNLAMNHLERQHRWSHRYHSPIHQCTSHSCGCFRSHHHSHLHRRPQKYSRSCCRCHSEMGPPSYMRTKACYSSSDTSDDIDTEARGGTTDKSSCGASVVALGDISSSRQIAKSTRNKLIREEQESVDDTLPPTFRSQSTSTITLANASTMAPPVTPEPKPGTTSVGVGSEKTYFDLSPRHHIRTPILEESESLAEAEGMMRSSNFQRQPLESAEWLDQRNWNEARTGPRNRSQNNTDSPEPAYADTKASILRRRNTMAKLLQEEGQRNFQSSLKTFSFLPTHQSQLRANVRYLSLEEISGKLGNPVWTRISPKFPHGGGNMRRWRSLSGEDLIRRPLYQDSPQRHYSTTYYKSRLSNVQPKNIYVVPAPFQGLSESPNRAGTLTSLDYHGSPLKLRGSGGFKEPRKFSKHNPQTRRYRSDRAGGSVRRQQNMLTRNMEILQHDVRPTIAQVNSFPTSAGKLAASNAESLPSAHPMISEQNNSEKLVNEEPERDLPDQQRVILSTVNEVMIDPSLMRHTPLSFIDDLYHEELLDSMKAVGKAIELRNGTRETEHTSKGTEGGISRNPIPNLKNDTEGRGTAVAPRYMDWYKKGPNHRHKGQDEQPMKQPDQEKSGRHCQDLAGYVDGMEDIQEYNISDDAKLEQQRSVTEEALRQDDLPSATQAQSGSDETAAIEERSLVPSRAEHPVSSSPKDLWIRPNSAEVLLD